MEQTKQWGELSIFEIIIPDRRERHIIVAATEEKALSRLTTKVYRDWEVAEPGKLYDTAGIVDGVIDYRVERHLVSEVVTITD